MKSVHIKKLFAGEKKYSVFIQWWLTTVLVILPFQSKIAVFLKQFSSELSDLIVYLDELTVIVLLPVALFKIYRNKEYPIRIYSSLLFPILLLIILGIISGWINGNSFTVTVLGIIDYVEDFFVIFIFAAFFKSFDESNDVYQVLIKIALFLVALALIQEVWALISRYYLETEKINLSNWRLGIYRPASLMRSPNVFGLYILLIFIIYLSLAKKLNYIVFIIFLTGMLLSMSRVVYAGLIFLCIVQIYRRKKPFILVLLPILALLLTMVFFKDIDFDKRVHARGTVHPEGSTYSAYREKTRQTAISVWRDNLFFGVGPGMYGGEISIKYNSIIYSKYSYSSKLMWYLRQTNNIDQFWFQILAEMGIFGVMAVCFLFINIIIAILILRIWASSYSIGNLFIGLLIITMTIILFTTYTGLKNTSLMFTYSAILGMAIGSQQEQIKKAV